MEPHRERIRKLVELTNSEKRGMLFFLFLVILSLYLPEIHRRFFRHNIDLTAYEKVLNEPIDKREVHTKNQNSVEPIARAFDPNKSSVQELNALGIPVYLSKRIDSYRKSGGRFESKEDLLKIYGLDKELFNRLKPFITIEETEKDVRRNKVTGSPNVKSHVFLDINNSDSTELVSIRGIGPVYASRIIRYRRALGGFYTVEQLKEVYGISDSLFVTMQGNIYMDTISAIEKMAINHIGLQELKSHPYFRSYNLCNAILKYRDQHGAYKSAGELKNIHLMNDSILEKIIPYLSFE